MALYYLGNGSFKTGDEKSVAVEKHQVRVKIFFSGICGTDYHIANGEMDGRIASFPRIIGHEASGEIIETGNEVKKWKVGDRVVIRPLQVCGICPECSMGNENICTDVQYLGIEKDGSFQKNWVVEESILHKIPQEIDYKNAALAEPLAVCCHAVKRSEILSDQKAVVIGGGPIGIMTALILKSRNNRVIVSEIDPGRLKNCKELGIETVNSTREDLPSKIREWTKGRGVSVVFEASGSQQGLDISSELLCPNGKIVTIATYGKVMNLDIRKLHFKQITLVTTRAYQKEDFETALSLLKQQGIPFEALITKIVPLTKLQEYFEDADKGSSEIKVLVDCQNGE
jgi:2-desacetyl-2-hydroxyethyl bacteriochlorophyllide A dehydrogenase